MTSAQEYEYDVALSYAGEDREYATALADILKSRGVKVFYDQYEKPFLWGKDLYAHLSEVYQQMALYCVIFISRHYASKIWTKHELQAAQARSLGENKEYILPIRLDSTDIPGLLPTIAYLNWHQETPETIADMIMKKLGKLSSKEKQTEIALLEKLRQEQKRASELSRVHNMLQETEAELAALVNAISFFKHKKLRRQDIDFIAEAWRRVRRKIGDIQYFAEQQMTYLEDKRFEIRSDSMSGPLWILELLNLQNAFDASLEERNVKEMADILDDLLWKCRTHIKLIDSRLFVALSASDMIADQVLGSFHGDSTTNV